MCYAKAETAFCVGMGVKVGTPLMDSYGGKEKADSSLNDLQRLCQRLDRRYEYAAIRQIGVPEREHFFWGLSLGLAFAWCGDELGTAWMRLAVSILSGCLGLTLANRHLGANLFALPPWMATLIGQNNTASDATDSESGRECGIARLCWRSRLHSPSSLLYWLLPDWTETLLDTRAMLVWVSHLLGFSLAGLLAAFFDAGSVIYDGASSGGDFAHRFWNLM